MKKRIILFVMMLCLLAMPMTCLASDLSYDPGMITENMVLLDSGYTEDGVYYEVFGEPINVNVGARVLLDVDRTVVYVGEVFPPETMEWTEKISGVEMSGTLYLQSFLYNARTNRTTAYYSGTLSN